MKLSLALFSAFLFMGVATATQLPDSTFNEGEMWTNNQLSIEVQAGPVVMQDWADMSLPEMIDYCLANNGVWNHSNNLCYERLSSSAKQMEMMEASSDAEAMDDEEVMEEMMEKAPMMSHLADSTFNQGETWFSTEAGQ